MGLFGKLFGGYNKKPGRGYNKKPGREYDRGVTKPTSAKRAGLFQPKPVAYPADRPVATPFPITLGRSSPPTGQRTSIGVPHSGVEMFLAGTHTFVTSSWLKAVKYDRASQELETWFLDGFHCYLEEVSEELAADFFDAPSKGGWWHTTVLGPNWNHGHGTTLMHWH